MKLSTVKKADPKAALVWLAYEKEEGFANAFGRTASVLRARLADEGFKGSEGQGAFAHLEENGRTIRVVALGLGRRPESDVESFRRAGGRLARRCAEHRLASACVEWPERGLKGDPRATAKAFAEGALLGAYRFDRYLTMDRDSLAGLESLAFAGRAASRVSAALRTARVRCEAVLFARDLVNLPASEVTPRRLVEESRAIARRGPIRLKVYGRAELKRMGAGGILAVNAGSAQEPYLIHLHYRKGAGKPLALVGKGITFDSGGLSLKPAGSMETMKMDMSGAAAVLGVFRALAASRPSADVHGIVAATENMPGGRAYKPGDILTAMNGKTMEVLNTDAEGRLVLADALSYAARLKPAGIIDLATLTGACVVALGPLIAGAMTNDAPLLERVKVASEAEGEPLWEMPLPREYRDDIKSRVADIKNIGPSREAGTLIGGLFLKEFVGDRPWVHLDIAGPAWMDRLPRSRPYLHLGGTGFFVRSLLALLERP